jgi:RNase P/RNase MRP subunit p29
VEISLTDNKQLLRIDSASEMELEQLNISLNKRIESWRFNPLVKKGLWDGYISYIKDDKWIPSGLWREIMEIAKEYSYDLKLNGITNLFDRAIKQEDFEAWALNFFEGHPDGISPRDYQMEAAFNILKFRRCLAELATSAGKTLISFLTVAYILEKQKAEKILFIVPNVSLVVQASEDFLDYNWQNRVPIKVQQIYSGQKIRAGRNVVIGTYQSLVKKSADYFDQFDAVIVDECLHPDTLITMSNGSKKRICEVKKGDWVKTTNDNTLQIENRQVDFVYKNLSQGNQMFEIEMEDGSIIKITGNHKVKLSSGIYKRVDELTEDDDILSFN